MSVKLNRLPNFVLENPLNPDISNQSLAIINTFNDRMPTDPQERQTLGMAYATMGYLHQKLRNFFAALPHYQKAQLLLGSMCDLTLQILKIEAETCPLDKRAEAFTKIGDIYNNSFHIFHGALKAYKYHTKAQLVRIELESEDRADDDRQSRFSKSIHQSAQGTKREFSQLGIDYELTTKMPKYE